jgi:preprotein translocase subunit SecY
LCQIGWALSVVVIVLVLLVGGHFAMEVENIPYYSGVESAIALIIACGIALFLAMQSNYYSYYRFAKSLRLPIFNR